MLTSEEFKRFTKYFESLVGHDIFVDLCELFSLSNLKNMQPCKPCKILAKISKKNVSKYRKLVQKPIHVHVHVLNSKKIKPKRTVAYSIYWKKEKKNTKNIKIKNYYTFFYKNKKINVLFKKLWILATVLLFRIPKKFCKHKYFFESLLKRFKKIQCCLLTFFEGFSFPKETRIGLALVKFF